MAIGKLLRSWAETGHCKVEGGYEQSRRRGGWGQKKMTAAESKHAPLLFPKAHMHTHGFPTPSALMSPDWTAC